MIYISLISELKSQSTHTAYECMCFIPFPKQALVYTCLLYKSLKKLKKNCGKRRNDRNEQFLLCPQCFLSIWRTFCHFHQIRNCRLQTLSVWKSLKFVVWERVKESLSLSPSTYSCHVCLSVCPLHSLSLSLSLFSLSLSLSLSRYFCLPVCPLPSLSLVVCVSVCLSRVNSINS